MSSIPEKKTQLIDEYIDLRGEPPSPLIANEISEIVRAGVDHEWVVTGCDVEPIHVIAKQPKTEELEETALAISSDNLTKYIGTVSIDQKQAVVLKRIFSEAERNTLIETYSHSFENLLEEFSMDRFVECFLSGVPVDVIAAYLGLRPSQLRSWLLLSPERLLCFQRAKDMLRSGEVDDTLDQAIRYKPGMINDPVDKARELLKLEAMKMRTKVATHIDDRSRIKDRSEEPSLPMVNLGVQINLDSNSKAEVKDIEARPVMPKIPGD